MTHPEHPSCDHCYSPIWPASLSRVRDWLLYHLWLALPACPRSRWLERLWWAILPRAGAYAYSCHCAREQNDDPS